MRNKVILCLKTAWLVAALIILLTGTNMCVSTDEACSAAGDTMFLFMFVLSFPLGTVFFLIAILFLESAGGHYPSDYITAWFIMACGGCCQWFIVAPRLFAKPTFTLINLRNSQVPSVAISPPSIATSPSLITASQSNNLLSAEIAPINIRAHKVKNRIVPFDRRGRTPLERVINRL
jgi:hypothetical protein